MKTTPAQTARFLVAALLSACLATTVYAAPATFTWNTTTASTAWMNSGNWTGGTLNKAPGIDLNASSTIDNDANDIALFTTIAASSPLGINMSTSGNTGVGNNTGANGLLSIGCINFNGSKSIVIGDSTATSGLLRLNGATVNVGGTGGSIANLLVAVNDSSSFNLTLQDAGGGTGFMGIQLGITGGNIYVTGSRTLTIGSVISELNSGSGFTKLGAGTLSLTNVNTYTGDTTLTAGILNLGLSIVTLGNGTGVINLNGGNLAANSSTSRTLQNPITMSANSIVSGIGVSGSRGTVSGRFIGFASSTFVNTAGTMTVRNIGGTSATMFALKFTGGGFTFSRPISVDLNTDAGLAQLEFSQTSGAGTQTFSGVISSGGTGNGNILRNSTGTTILSGANTYPGGSWLAGGFLGLGIDSVGTPPTLTSGPIGRGALNVTNGATSAGIFASGSARTVGNAIALGGQANTLTINGANSLTLSGSVGMGAFGQTFQIDNTADTTFSGVITNASVSGSAVTKTGSGKLIFTGNNSYTGETTINNGTLLVNNASGSGTSTGLVTVASGGTLGGTGTISGAITVQSGGNLAPGTSIGTLTVGSTLLLAGTTTIEVDKGAGQTSDKVLGITTLTEGGTLQVANIGAALAAGDSFPVFSATTYSGSFASVTPAPGAGLAWDTEKLRTNGVLLVHNQPVAGSDVASAQHGQTTTIPVVKLLANDTGEVGETLSITAVSANASLGGGLVTYTAPLTGNSDTITYTLSDGRGGTNTGTINVALTGSGSFNQISSVLLGGGDMELTYLGIPGTNYALDRTFNLTPPVTWVPQITNPAGGNGYLIFTNTPDPSTNNFWRTRYVP